ncbi:hypothetical protein [Lactiplantibacillus pentosus]|uniref:hypothetical protein n=1 Tax=Lactiplantibacillus pentosus TaxID=1589 RepID=UPI0018C8AE46|nr:hypothetical protein [Lactiplantibacillus pentosus]MDO7805614.1 hypothetical protein [Lactiplantibacillus pentosus]WFC02802.1 hypothetical protein PGN10_13065 [Lactiplantibacillus pentosus]
MNISKILSEHVSDVIITNDASSKLYEAPKIPDKKLNNAIKAMQIDEAPEDMRAIIDTTLFQTGKTGIAFTNKHVYFHEVLTDPDYFAYSDILDATYTEELKTTKGKQKIIPHVQLSLAGEQSKYKVPETILSCINAKALTKLLRAFATPNTETGADDKEDYQTQGTDSKAERITIYSLEDLPAQTKLAYAELLCNFAMRDDHQIDSSEYRSIISFAVRINLGHEEQIQLNSYLIGEQLINSAELLDQLQSQINEATNDILSKSLMKDLLSIVNQKASQSIDDWQADGYLAQLAESLDLSVEEVDVLVTSIHHDQLILDQRLNDTQIKKQTKDLAAKAAAVGIPLTALYFSGTVGVSAAGITSGLASLGFGGLLGFSGMVSGIGIIILAGTATYKGVEFFTGRKDVENNKQREALLQQIIRNTQKTLNYLIENVNEVSQQLISATQVEQTNSIKIQKLTKLLALLSKGAQKTTTDLDHFQSESILTQVPEHIEVSRLAQLTKQPTTQKYYDIVLANYEKDENGRLTLKPTISSDDAAMLHAILDKIGYLTIKGVAKSGLSGAASNVKHIFD